MPTVLVRVSFHLKWLMKLFSSSSHKVVSSSWLMQWRKFMQGRGARRYLPPGPINNYDLVTAHRREKQLTIPEQKDVKLLSRIDGNESKRQQQEQKQLQLLRRQNGVGRLILGEDYHVVNFNVWQYWSMVYGGESSQLHASRIP